MNTNKTLFYLINRVPRWWVVLGAVLLLGACSSGGGGSSQSGTANPYNLNMQIPASLTGGPATAVSAVAVSAAIQATADSDQPCAYQGPDDHDDPFRNGYEMTKFMVSVVASWTCWADTLIDISAYVPHDGLIYPTDNQTDNANYKPNKPTHYSVVDDSDTQTTIRIYYGYDPAVPPLPGTDPQFYISFSQDEQGNIQGRLIIQATGIDPVHRDPKDPSMARMDFNFTDTQELATMYLQFDDGNLWADGFRIEVTHDLTANPLQQVFTARGLVTMKRQFFDLPGISELPTLAMVAVSDRVGEGAAIAKIDRFALPLSLNVLTGNYLGNYIFDKTDIYFFDADQKSAQPWDWINKTFTAAEYRGERTTPATGGTLDPFDPSLDLIASVLGLPDSYFTGSDCANVGDSCVDMFNAVYDKGFGGQEGNQGADPGDWRSVSLQDPQYLTTVFPNGIDWSGAFDFSFTPVP